MKQMIGAVAVDVPMSLKMLMGKAFYIMTEMQTKI